MQQIKIEMQNNASMQTLLSYSSLRSLIDSYMETVNIYQSKARQLGFN